MYSKVLKVYFSFPKFHPKRVFLPRCSKMKKMLETFLMKPFQPSSPNRKRSQDVDMEDLATNHRCPSPLLRIVPQALLRHLQSCQRHPQLLRLHPLPLCGHADRQVAIIPSTRHILMTMETLISMISRTVMWRGPWSTVLRHRLPPVAPSGLKGDSKRGNTATHAPIRKQQFFKFSLMMMKIAMKVKVQMKHPRRTPRVTITLMKLRKQTRGKWMLQN